MTYPASALFQLRLAAALLVATSPYARAAAQKSLLSTTPDASWTREYAGNRQDIKSDPRFIPLLKASFSQHQWLWRDHSRFTPLPQFVQLFIGVPGGVIVNENRYVTADGCVPHACTDRGMVWIDTGSQPATLIFAAADQVSGGPETHLWLFVSKHLNTGQMPLAFLSSLHQWIDKNNADIDSTNDPMLASAKEDVILVTVVQPSQQQVELKYSMLSGAKNESGVKK